MPLIMIIPVVFFAFRCEGTKIDDYIGDEYLSLDPEQPEIDDDYILKSALHVSLGGTLKVPIEPDTTLAVDVFNQDETLVDCHDIGVSTVICQQVEWY